MQDISTGNSTLVEPTRMTASYASSVGCQEEILPCTATASTYLSFLMSNGLGMKN